MMDLSVKMRNTDTRVYAVCICVVELMRILLYSVIFEMKSGLLTVVLVDF